MISQDVSGLQVPISTSKMPAALLEAASGSQAYTDSFQSSRHLLCQYFSRHLLLSHFPLLTQSPFWLFTLFTTIANSKDLFPTAVLSLQAVTLTAALIV